eukprot:2552313-Rhodomonas_salina.1
MDGEMEVEVVLDGLMVALLAPPVSRYRNDFHGPLPLPSSFPSPPPAQPHCAFLSPPNLPPLLSHLTTPPLLLPLPNLPAFALTVCCLCRRRVGAVASVGAGGARCDPGAQPRLARPPDQRRLQGRPPPCRRRPPPLAPAPVLLRVLLFLVRVRLLLLLLLIQWRTDRPVWLAMHGTETRIWYYAHVARYARY